MRHWSAEFQLRSLCSFGESDGGPSGDSTGGGSDFSGDFSGFTGGFDPSGDPTGSTLSNADFFGDTTGGPTFSDTTGGPAFSDGGGPTFSDGGGPTFSDAGTNFYSTDMGGQNFSADTFGQFQGPTAGVDFTGSGPGWGAGPSSTNFGMNNAVGPPGWATSDYGVYGTGGPTNTGFGPGASLSIGGPNYAAAPGINGFPGDFAAPPGGAFGMPGGGQAGPQAGPGLPGGPGNVGTAEPGFMPIGPETTTPTVQDDRTDAAPNFFGPENTGPQTASANQGSFFGPSQAQAAGMTDRGATDVQNMENAFQDVGRVAEFLSQSNPDLAQALTNVAANMQAQQAMLGPNITGFEGSIAPGAQQGFTGVSPAQAAAGGPFTGQPSLSSESTQGKGDRGDTMPTVQAYPGIQPGAISPTADPALQAGLDTRAAMMQAQQGLDQQALGEQGKGQTTATAQPDSRASDAFDALAGRGPGLTQTDFESRFGDPNQFMPNYDLSQPPPAATRSDTFDSRFGTLPPAQEQNQPATFDSRFGEWGQPTRSADIPNLIETIARSGPELTTGLIGPLTQGVGREAAPLGLLSMSGPGRQGGEAAPFGGGRSSGPFGDPGRSGSPLSVTVSPNQFSGGRASSGYYNTGGAGIAPGAKGAEFGGVYGAGVATGRPGTGTFGVSSREGAYGFYDPVTGVYYR